MSDEQQLDSAEDTADATTTEDNSHLKKAIAARDKAKQEVRQLRSAMSDMKAQLEEFNAMKESLAEQEALAAKDFEKVKESYSKKLEAAQSQIQELQNGIKQREMQEKRNAMLDGLQRRTGADRDLVDALFQKATAEGIVQVPEEVDDHALEEAFTVLGNRFENLLKPQSPPSSQPGLSPSLKPKLGRPKPTDTSAFNLGKALSRRRK